MRYAGCLVTVKADRLRWRVGPRWARIAEGLAQ